MRASCPQGPVASEWVDEHLTDNACPGERHLAEAAARAALCRDNMIYKNTRTLRLLMRGLLAIAAVLAGLDLLLLSMRLMGWLEADQALVARVFSATVSVVLLAGLFVVVLRLDLALKAAQQSRQLLEAAIEALPATFELYDASDRLVLWNKALVDAYPHMAQHLPKQLRFEELARLNIAAGVQPEYSADPDGWVKLRQQQRRGPQASLGTLSTNGRGGWLRRYETQLADGSIVTVRVDVTEAENQRRALDEAQQALERSRQRLEDAIEALPAGFEMYDADDRLVMVNSTNLEMYPHLADLPGSAPTFEQVVRINADRGGLPMLSEPEALDAWIEQRQIERRQESSVRVHRVGERRWVRVHERRMRDDGLVSIRLDVSDLMQREADLIDLSRRLELMNKDLSVLSQTDPLTGIANRRAFDMRLSEEVSYALRYGTPLALLLVDVDHFKRYNDRYGHPAGDECLRRVAQLLRDSATRPTDLVVRLGGEEFALLLANHDGATAVAFAQRCLQAVASARIEHADSESSDVVTVSIGVADLVGCGTPTPAALLASADAALYQAKQRGRNRVVCDQSAIA